MDNQSVCVAYRADRAKYINFLISDEVSEMSNSSILALLPGPDSVDESVGEKIVANVNSRDDETWLWHQRLDHVSAKYLRWAVDKVEGLPSTLRNIRVDEFHDSAFSDIISLLYLIVVFLLMFVYY